MILVDKRVGSSFTSSHGKHFDMYKAIYDRTNGNASLTLLPSGDFAFEGNGPTGPVYVGVERKAIRDMLGSMRSDRYAGIQARNMSDDYDVCYLIVEGLYRPNVDGILETPIGGGWAPLTLASKGGQIFQYSELDKHLTSMELRKNVIMVRSTSPIETVWQVVNRYQWWQKQWDSHQSSDPIKVQTEVRFAKTSWLREIASRLPGVGWERSKLIEDHFENIYEFVNAFSSEIRAAGIGEKLAVKLHGLFRGRG